MTTIIKVTWIVLYHLIIRDHLTPQMIDDRAIDLVGCLFTSDTKDIVAYIPDGNISLLQYGNFEHIDTCVQIRCPFKLSILSFIKTLATLHKW